MNLAPVRIRIPATESAPEPDPPRFPLVATLAPIGLALVIWAITRSPYTLAFALLGPVIAVAGVWDARRQRTRRRRRSEADRRARSAERAAAISAAAARERERLIGMVATHRDEVGVVLRRWAGSDATTAVTLGAS